MTIQFLDSRVSENRNDCAGTTTLSAIPALFGDIVLHTAAVAGTPNAGDVHIELWGTIGVNGISANSVTIQVQRGISAVFDSGTLIYTTTENFTDGPGNRIISFHAVDFHPPVAEVNARALRYTMFVSATDSAAVTMQDLVSFSGMAQAGKTTSSFG